MGSNDGDEIIERTAKRLISEGFPLVSKNMAAFAYLFGRGELKKLNHYAFDYICTKHDICNNHNYEEINEEVFNLSDIIAYAVLRQYRGLSEEAKEKVKIEYPKESELERMVRNSNIELIMKSKRD